MKRLLSYLLALVTRRRVRHYEVIGMLPSRGMIMLPEGYRIDEDGIIVSREGL
jgi:hypothetical protein